MFLVPSGIQFTSEGLCQYADYGVIEETLKGEISIYAPLLIETVQPPTSMIQYIQLHRLSGNENLSHLLLVYHHYSAAKAVIFVNTSNEFQLHQNLLDTLPVNPQILCFIITKSAGTDLVDIFSLFQSIQCRINSFSTDSAYLVRPTEVIPRASRYLHSSQGICYMVSLCNKWLICVILSLFMRY